MHKKAITTVVLTVLLCGFACLAVAARAEIQALINAYEKGDPEKSRTLLMRINPENAEERATVQYYQALLGNDVDSVKVKLATLADTYLKTRYGQKALFELGSLHLLDRDYTKALEYFNKITDPDLSEKHYWIANTYFQKGDYTNAVNSGNQFTRLTKSSPKLEDTYYLIADAYISLSQFNNAITTLKKLLSQPELIEDMQYLRYRYGYAAEMLGNRSEAISQYRQGYEINRFSQLAYLIEDRLFEMRFRYGTGIDLSFLYPHAALPLPDIVLAEQGKTGKITDPDKQDTSVEAKPDTTSAQSDASQPGLYLQAGRFSVQANADKLGDRIRSLGLNARVQKSTQFKDVSWVVIVGPYQNQLDAVTNKQLLKDNEIDSFIIQR
jgi:tetratricopeptide (TPR) repeat protein